MRRLLSLLAASLLLAANAEAKTPLADWAGVYKHQFKNGDVEGHSYQSEDILELVPVDDTHAYVRIALEFFNGHSCSFAEVMTLEDARLIWRGKKEYDFDPCTLGVSADQSKIRIEDISRTCLSYYCGARGMLDGASWPLSAKRPIRYMDRLKGSREFKDAIASAKSAPKP